MTRPHARRRPCQRRASGPEPGLGKRLTPAPASPEHLVLGAPRNLARSMARRPTVWEVFYGV